MMKIQVWAGVVVAMQRRILLVITLYVFFGASFAAAQDAAFQSGPGLDSTTSEVALVPWATVVKDAEKTKTVVEMLNAPLSRLHPDRDAISFRFSDAAYWFIVPVINNEKFPLERILVFEPTWLDDVEVTLVDSQGERQSFAGGDARTFAQRAELRRQTNFRLLLQPGNNKLIVRVATRDPFFVAMSLMDEAAFYELASSDSKYFGLFYGGLLSLLLFNFMLFTSTRENMYLAYSLHVTAFLTMYTIYNGNAFGLLFPDSPELSNWSHSVSIYLYSLTGIVFARVFLDLKRKEPSLYALWKRILIAWLVSCVVTLFPSGYSSHVLASIIWVILFSVFSLLLGLAAVRHRNNAAGLYLSASVAGFCGSSVTALTVLGELPYTFTTYRAADFGMLIDAIMLSLAISDRISKANRLERLRRFFSPAVADQLLSASSEDLYRPHHREIVVMFLDLRGYTAFTVKHGADEVMRVLGEFHSVMGELIASYGATLERFAGDGMMIFFNDPVEIPDPEAKACRMALEMQARFEELNRTWETRNYSLSLGVGIAQGVATIGAIGFEGRRDYAAIGNVTNLAARLCSQACGGQIIISSTVARNIREILPVQPIQPLVLKGFSEPVECYELVALREHHQHPEPVSLARPEVVPVSG
jgi:class 3 adenylate cyclase